METVPYSHMQFSRPMKITSGARRILKQHSQTRMKATSATMAKVPTSPRTRKITCMLHGRYLKIIFELRSMRHKIPTLSCDPRTQLRGKIFDLTATYRSATELLGMGLLGLWLPSLLRALKDASHITFRPSPQLRLSRGSSDQLETLQDIPLQSQMPRPSMRATPLAALPQHNKSR